MRRNGAEKRLPDDLQAAIERGDLTTVDVRALIRHEAGALGVSFREAVRRAMKTHTLPRNHLAADLG